MGAEWVLPDELDSGQACHRHPHLVKVYGFHFCRGSAAGSPCTGRGGQVVLAVGAETATWGSRLGGVRLPASQTGRKIPFLPLTAKGVWKHLP